MTKSLAPTLSLLLMVFMSGCAYSIHEVQVSDFQPYAPTASGRLIAGHGVQTVVLGFKGNTNYINEAKADIEKQCRGPITGLTTQISTDLGFFFWRNRALIQGYCNEAKSAAKL